jgi:membrane peptidoglycan carboxypeptidase
MVGYTPQLSTAVWVGTDKGGALKNYSGATIYGSGLPAQIWRTAMNRALDGQPIESFPEPTEIGGVAGVPYEAPPETYTTTTARPPSTTTAPPTTTTPPGVTLAPGVVIPLPGQANPDPDTETETEPTLPAEEGGPGRGSP